MYEPRSHQAKLFSKAVVTILLGIHLQISNHSQEIFFTNRNAESDLSSSMQGHKQRNRARLTTALSLRIELDISERIKIQGLDGKIPFLVEGIDV